MSSGAYELTLNTAKFGKLIDEKPSAARPVAYFRGESNEPGYLEAKQ